MRAMLREETVEDYAEQMELANGWGPYPPVEVTYDGETYYLTDGFHRTSAARRHFDEDFLVPAIVTPGTYKDALKAAARANDTNGLQRSRADKRRAVTRIMQEPEWASLSDSIIADMCAVTSRFVGNMRAEMVNAGTVKPVTQRQGKDGRVTNIANVGRQPKPVANGAPVAAPEPLPSAPPEFKTMIPENTTIVLTPEVKTIEEPVNVLGPQGEARLPEREGGPTRLVVVATPAAEPAVIDKPSQLISAIHKRGSAQKIYEALVAGALRNYLTPAENDYELKAFAKALNEGIRT